MLDDIFRLVQENHGVLCSQDRRLIGFMQYCNVDWLYCDSSKAFSFFYNRLPRYASFKLWCASSCPLWATVVHSLTFVIWSFTFRLPRLQPLQLFLWPRYVLKVTKHLAWWYFADLSKKTLEFFVVKIIDYRIHVMLQCELTLLRLIENIFILL